MDRRYDMRLFFHGETDDTIKVSVDGDAAKGVWLAKSKIYYHLQSSTVIHVSLPERLVLEKGLDSHLD